MLRKFITTKNRISINKYVVTFALCLFQFQILHKKTPYTKKEKKVKKVVEPLLEKMTLDEKLAQIEEIDRWKLWKMTIFRVQKKKLKSSSRGRMKFGIFVSFLHL